MIFNWCLLAYSALVNPPRLCGVPGGVARGGVAGVEDIGPSSGGMGITCAVGRD